jgi:hypothetical protein
MMQNRAEELGAEPPKATDTGTNLPGSAKTANPVSRAASGHDSAPPTI